MPLSYKIAKRYLFSKKSTNAINIIAGITIFAMAFGTIAMIVIMSIFNGFEGLVIDRYNVFYSDVKIEPAKGKYFDLTEEQINALKAIEGVDQLSTILEEDALVEYNDEQYVATVKGVDTGYLNIIGLNEDYIINGSLMLYDDNTSYAIIGAGVRNNLRINVNIPSKIKINIPRKNARLTSIESAFNFEYITPIGEFNVQQEFDEKYVLVPQSFVRSIRGEGEDFSSVELKLKPNADKNKTIKAIATLLPDTVVKNRWQQNATLYTVMRTEKWVVFAILTFVILIVAFSITGALSMLIVEKKKDIAVLRAIGASSKTIQQIFLLEGILLSFVGVFIGVFLSVSFCLLQQYVGIIPMPGASFIVDFYPVRMKIEDFAATLSAIFLISLLASYFPTLRAVQNDNISESMRVE
ncbi:MAG: FtsX-like permease family protein [Chitinophagales bacterium]